MKVIIVGAGVIGITSAWYLTKQGHDVTVIEAREGPGLETSFSNAGGICPGFAGPWAAPGMPAKALSWMLQPYAPLKISPKLDAAQWAWLLQFWRNCTRARFAQNKASMQEMAHFSKTCLVELREETGIAYDHGTGGVLQIFSTPEELDHGQRSARVLEGLGVSHRLLRADEAVQVEPALANSEVQLTGALHLDTDETGDCHLFCVELAKLCAERGCTFLYNTKVTSLVVADGKIVGAELGDGIREADAVVLATGPWANSLLAPLGLKVPVYPVKGYAMTCTITDQAKAPQSSVMDEHSKVMVTRLGNRVRAAGIAEVAGFDPAMPSKTLSWLRRRVEDLFPGAANYDAADYWHGFRPMTPNGPSLVERRGYPNLYVNLGHGSNGWTQACGAGKRLSELIH